MFDIKFSHSTNTGASAKLFYFVANPGQTIEVKVPNQAQQIIHLAYYYSEENENSPFTFQQLADYIDECSSASNTVFTTSNGGTIRIIRYYSKLLQEIGVLSTTAPQPEEESEQELDFNDE